MASRTEEAELPLACWVAHAVLASVSCYPTACVERLLRARDLRLWDWLAGEGEPLSPAQARSVLQAHTWRLGQHGQCALAFWYDRRQVQCRAVPPAAATTAGGGADLCLESVVCARTQTGCVVGWSDARRKFWIAVRGTWTAPNHRLDLDLHAERGLARGSPRPAGGAAPPTLRDGLGAAAQRFYEQNPRAPDLKLHRGFCRAATPPCFCRLQELLRRHPPDELYVVGMSLGGAMAPLLVVGLANTLGWDPGPAITCVTFGAPKLADRAGNELLLSEFRRGGRRRWLRLYRSSDWVPTLPPVLWERAGAYQHPEPAEERRGGYRAFDLEGWAVSKELQWWGSASSPADAAVRRTNRRHWGHWWYWLPAYPALS